MHIASLVTHSRQLLQGRSYWQATLTNGRVVTECEQSFDLLRGHRPVDWALDIVGSGDNGHISALTLCTPKGNATLAISTPYTAFQLKRAVSNLFSYERIVQAQVIGRVDNTATGVCTAVIWDVATQHLYIDHMTNVHHFSSWREGTADIGALHLEVVGLRLH